MKLSNNTINVLKNFSSINSSIVVQPGNVLKTISESKTIMSKAVVDNEFSSKFAIYRLDRFLSTLSLFNDPELTFNEKYVLISDEKRKTKYVYCQESLVKTPPEKNIKLPSSEVEMSISNESFKDIEKAASILGFENILIVGDGEHVSLQTENTKDDTSDVHSIVVGDTDKTFRAIYKTMNLKFIPADYDVSISKGISMFVAKNLPFSVEYYVAVEQNSTF